MSNKGIEIISIDLVTKIRVCLTQRWGFLGGSVVESACQCGRHGFHPWKRKIPWRGKWQPTVVFLTGKCHGTGLVAAVHGVAKEADTT